ncbi:MAG: FtsX-like permease family protein [Betaproteobacteria bacterium]
MPWPVAWRLCFESLRAYRARQALAVLAIALGVAMGLAIEIVNRSALEEFRRALASINGNADASLRSASGHLDARIFAKVANDPRVREAAPILHLPVTITGLATGRAGDATASIEIWGIDLFRAAQVNPGLLPDFAALERPDRWFGGDVVYASAGLALRLQTMLAATQAGGGSQEDRASREDRASKGDRGSQEGGVALRNALPPESDPRALALRTLGRSFGMTLGGSLAQATAGRDLLVTDIASLQEASGLHHAVSRIDIRWKEPERSGNGAELLAELAQDRQATSLLLVRPDDEAERMSNLSRAYRVNLGILALVALLTGVFIVQSNMQLLASRQLPSLAILGVLGASRHQIQALMRLQALALGLTGALLGAVLGIALAWILLARTGGDLGSGLIRSSGASVRADASLLFTALFHGALGVGVAWLGALAPVRAMGRLSPIAALKGALPAARASAVSLAWLSAALLGMGAAGLVVAPLGHLPIGAYAALALWLCAGLLAMPLLIQRLAQGWSRRGALNWLTRQRALAAPLSLSFSMTGIVASVSLCVAVTLMIGSFRDAVSAWLDHVLPADVYARVLKGETPMDQATQQSLAALPGLRRTEFQQVLEVTLATDRPPVLLIVRELDPATAQSRLPVTGALLPPHPEMPSVWVSEAMVDLYGWTIGSAQQLPLLGIVGADSTTPAPIRVFVAGVWRDYARQSGSIVIERRQWLASSGRAQLFATDVGWTLEPARQGVDASPEQQVSKLVNAIDPAIASTLEIRTAQDIRQLSMRIFDRSFTVTYALQAVALLIGLLGVTGTLASQSTTRLREFAVLRHLGLSRMACVRLLLLETGVVLAVALGWGMLLGLALAWILIDWVNPQSFHWSMDMKPPGGAIALGLVAVWIAGMLSGALVIRTLMQQPMLRNVKEDW